MTHNCLLNSTLVTEKVRQWLNEDISNFDYGGYVVGDNQESAVLLCKGQGVLAGKQNMSINVLSNEF